MLAGVNKRLFGCGRCRSVGYQLKGWSGWLKLHWHDLGINDSGCLIKLTAKWWSLHSHWKLRSDKCLRRCFKVLLCSVWLFGCYKLLDENQHSALHRRYIYRADAGKRFKPAKRNFLFRGNCSKWHVVPVFVIKIRWYYHNELCRCHSGTNTIICSL